MIVYKLDETGREVWQYPATLLERHPNAVRLEAFFNRPDMDLGYTTFNRQDRFVEYFYNDRWYNVFAIYDRDDRAHKGWYCNICRPAHITAEAVRCADLALDLWVAANGQTRILDEDEFASLTIPPHDRAHGLQALRQLLTLAQNGQLPT